MSDYLREIIKQLGLGQVVETEIHCWDAIADDHQQQIQVHLDDVSELIRKEQLPISRIIITNHHGES